jgi:hypothetical protein
MAYTGTLGQRPAELDGCWQAWSEGALPATIRSQAEYSHPIKVRRRTTASVKTADASVVVKQELVAHFQDWFHVRCQGGTLPTKIIHPDGTEQIWRFSEPPVFQWGIGIEPGKHYVSVTVKLESLPGWNP